MSTANTILVKYYSDIIQEAIASGAIKPGMALERTNASADTVKAHATAGGDFTPKMVAIENDLEGEGVTDTYASADQVRFAVVRAGDQVIALIANGQNITKGAKLMSNGDGYLRAYTAETEAAGAGDSSSATIATFHPERIFAIAREACDRSTSSGADASERCLVEIV